MAALKSEIIAQLKRDLRLLEPGRGLHVSRSGIDIGAINQAFPGKIFPQGVIHEFIFNNPVNGSATAGFVSGVIGRLMQQKGAAIWIGSNVSIHPPALANFGVAPDRIIFIQLKKEKEILWAMEEALKCEGLAAVVAEIPELSFMASRRLQLAVEKSKVTGFVLRINPRQENITACVTRWRITSAPSQNTTLPGVGFPVWKVELSKLRNGKPASWLISFAAGKFNSVSRLAPLQILPKVKTG